MKFSVIALPLAALIASVAAQTDCLKNCLNKPNIKAKCGFLDTGCYCSNKGFQDAMVGCIDHDCPKDKKQALDLQGQICK